MSLPKGTQLGPYEILAPIGAGGMGEVYLARDSRLTRDVAIKVSAERFSERFEREARAVAALNHPNVCTLHDVGPNYLVMEYVEGESPKGPMPLDDALRIARQIAGALDAAHEKGIVHRDLKPGNIKVRPDGTVKVLDFGLAKLEGAPAVLTENSPTLSIAATNAGVILGTAAYMSPEQARGKSVDKRADIWAFGVVLYELITGEQLFKGEDLTETLASVVKEQPDLNEVPPKVRRLLKKCLEKDPARRLRDIGDAWDLLEESDPQARAEGDNLFKSILRWTAIAVLATVAVGISFVHFRELPPDTPVRRTSILFPEETTIDFTNGLGFPALSPDGRKIVFGGRTSDGKTPLWIRSLDATTAQPLAGTDGARFPFWSPDSRYIGFFAQGKLKKIDAAGGSALTLTDAPNNPRGGSWSPEGVIVFAPTNNPGPLQRISEAGGAASAIAKTDGRHPWFLPDGRHFLYQNNPGPTGRVSIRVGAVDGDVDIRLDVPTTTNAVYSQGYLIYMRDSTLVAQAFDSKRLAVTGDALPIAEYVQATLNGSTVGVFSLSATGLLAYSTGSDTSGSLLTWFDRSGKRLATLGEQANFANSGRLSPDQTRFAVDLREGGDIWVFDVMRGIRSRLTFTPSILDRNAVWSPDGRAIVFRSLREHNDLYRIPADNTGAEELLYADDKDKSPTSWSPDKKFILYSSSSSKTATDIWVLPLTPEQPGGPLKPFVLVQSPSDDLEAQFSPDGHWIAYTSAESQRTEIYVVPFTGGASKGAGKQQVSTNGGNNPRWRKDGKEIFYLNRGQVMAAEVETQGTTFKIVQVRALFSPPVSTNGWDVSADGQRFLIPVVPELKRIDPLILIENWQETLKK